MHARNHPQPTASGAAREQSKEEHSREIRDVREQIEHRADAEPERARDLQRADRVLDLVQHVVDVRPPRVRVEHFECRRGVLGPAGKRERERERRLVIGRLREMRRREGDVHRYCCASSRRTRSGSWRVGL
jgi:hypothetical protein